MSKSKQQVYRERNLYAIALAVTCHKQFDTGGWYYDEGDWPVVWSEVPIDLGRGIVNWSQNGVHVPPHMGPLLEESALPNQPPEGGYDGHDRTQRLNRLSGYIKTPLGQP